MTNQKNHNHLQHIIIALCLTLLLAACSVTVVPPAPTREVVVVAATPTDTPVAPAVQTATATPLPPPPTPTPDTTPRVTASSSAVNLRMGPGVNYDQVGVLPQGQSLEIVGRNAEATWWQVLAPAGLLWVSADVTSASNVDATIPIVPAPPPPTSLPPTQTPTPPPPTPTPLPQYQYTIRNIFGQVNQAITQIRGDIRDRNGNPVNGVRVRVRSGDFCTVSFPSGPAGGYPNGVYDILLDNRAKDGQWQVAVVNGPADGSDTKCNPGLAPLSEEVTVPTNTLEGVVFVEWWKNY